MPVQLEQEHLWALLRSEGWKLLVNRLQSQRVIRERSVHRAIDNKDLNDAIEQEASYKLLGWVIELPHQLMKEFGNSGENTKKTEE